MERALGLMAGAGDLPGRAAAEARRQGWRVVAFAFAEAAGLAEQADELVAARLTDLGPVLEALATRGIGAVLFVGKLGKQEMLARAGEADEAGRGMIRRGLSDSVLAEMAVAALENLGIEVLDQRRFLGAWLATGGALASRTPTPEQWEEIRAGFELARYLAGRGIGQTVVRSRGVTVALEAVEGTDETIRRGTRLAGPGAVIVKAVAPGHDYRFDIPAVGPATLRAMAEGRAAVLALDGGKVLLLERPQMIELAERAGIAVVTVDGRER
jgi:DUF1009 family protein